MRKSLLILLSVCALGSVYSQNNDTLIRYFKLINSNLSKKELSETVNFDYIKFKPKHEAPLLNYVSRFAFDTSISVRQRAIDIITIIGKKSKNSTIRTQALNIYLQTYDFPGSYNNFSYFKQDDFNDSSKMLLLKIFKREATELDLKMQHLYYYNLGREIYLKNLRDSKRKEAEKKNISLDSLVNSAYNSQVERSIQNWKNKGSIDKDVIYTIGLLDMKEVIPLFRKELLNKRYYQPALKMALARLGDEMLGKRIVDSLRLIMLKSTTTSEFTNPFEALQYICTKNSISTIIGLLSLKTELQPYSDGERCKNIPIGFVSLKPLSEIIINFPIKKDRTHNLEPWCYTMDDFPVNEFISTAKKWLEMIQGDYELNRKLMIFPR